MDTPYAQPFMRGWVNVVDEEPRRDGRYVLFARSEERAKEEACPFVFGFWHSNQNTPGWSDSYGMKIVLEHWPRWKALEELSWSPLTTG